MAVSVGGIEPWCTMGNVMLNEFAMISGQWTRLFAGELGRRVGRCCGGMRAIRS
jgi:hypothetical protein